MKDHQSFDRQTKYDFLRAILVILVVVGHGSYYSINTPFGGVDYSMRMLEGGISDTVFHIFARRISSWIYTFHMPLFMALSGTVFEIGWKKGSYRRLLPYIWRKFKRLMIPFLVVWMLWNIPIKYITGYYEGMSLGRILLQMVFPSSVYLWFIESLFIIYILSWFICRINNKKLEMSCVLVLWLIGIILHRRFSQYQMFGDPLYYLFWFYIGGRMEALREWLERRQWLNSKSVFVLLGISLFLFIVYKRGLTNNKFIDAGLVYFALPFSMLIISFYFINHYRPKNEKWIEFFADYGMGIYLYAEPLNYLLLYCAYKLCGIECFGSEICSIALWLMRIFITSLIAVGITGLLKRMKLKYLY